MKFTRLETAIFRGLMSGMCPARLALNTVMVSSCPLACGAAKHGGLARSGTQSAQKRAAAALASPRALPSDWQTPQACINDAKWLLQMPYATVKASREELALSVASPVTDSTYSLSTDTTLICNELQSG